MSMKAVVWALHQNGLSPSQKIVLLMLADRHNPDLGCFPSIRRLANDCNMSRSGVFTHLKVLEQKGMILRIGRTRENGEQTSNEYTLLFNSNVQNLDSRVQKIDGGSAETGRGVVQKLDTNNHVSINHVIEHKVLRSVSIGFDNFWKDYPRKIGKAKAKKCYEKATSLHGVDKINDAVKVYAESVKSKEKRFIPHPTTWLSQGRWDDEVEEAVNIDHMFRGMVNDLARVRVNKNG